MGASTFEEAHAALKAIAGGRHFGVTVESSEHSNGDVDVDWLGYIADLGFTKRCPSAGSMLEQAALMAVGGVDGRKALADVGAPPATRASFGEHVEIERRKGAILSLVSALPAESPQ